MRPVLMAAGAAGVVGGGLLAARPFHVEIALSDGAETAGAACRPPLLVAWCRQPKGQLALWAVTYGDGSTGSEVRFGGEPYCAEAARRRLGAAVARITGALVVLVVAGQGGDGRGP